MKKLWQRWTKDTLSPVMRNKYEKIQIKQQVKLTLKAIPLIIIITISSGFFSYLTQNSDLKYSSLILWSILFVCQILHTFALVSLPKYFNLWLVFSILIQHLFAIKFLQIIYTQQEQQKLQNMNLYCIGYSFGIMLFWFINGTNKLTNLFILCGIFIELSVLQFISQGKLDFYTQIFILVTCLCSCLKVTYDEQSKNQQFLIDQQNQIYKKVIERFLPINILMVSYDETNQRILLSSSNLFSQQNLHVCNDDDLQIFLEVSKVSESSSEHELPENMKEQKIILEGNRKNLKTHLKQLFIESSSEKNQSRQIHSFRIESEIDNDVKMFLLKVMPFFSDENYAIITIENLNTEERIKKKEDQILISQSLGNRCSNFIILKLQNIILDFQVFQKEAQKIISKQNNEEVVNMIEVCSASICQECNRAITKIKNLQILMSFKGKKICIQSQRFSIIDLIRRIINGYSYDLRKNNQQFQLFLFGKNINLNLQSKSIEVNSDPVSLSQQSQIATHNKSHLEFFSPFSLSHPKYQNSADSHKTTIKAQKQQNSSYSSSLKIRLNICEEESNQNNQDGQKDSLFENQFRCPNSNLESDTRKFPLKNIIDEVENDKYEEDSNSTIQSMKLTDFQSQSKIQLAQEIPIFQLNNGNNQKENNQIIQYFTFPQRINNEDFEFIQEESSQFSEGNINIPMKSYEMDKFFKFEAFKKDILEEAKEQPLIQKKQEIEKEQYNYPLSNLQKNKSFQNVQKSPQNSSLRRAFSDTREHINNLDFLEKDANFPISNQEKQLTKEEKNQKSSSSFSQTSSSSSSSELDADPYYHTPQQKNLQAPEVQCFTLSQYAFKNSLHLPIKTGISSSFTDLEVIQDKLKVKHIINNFIENAILYGSKNSVIVMQIELDQVDKFTKYHHKQDEEEDSSYLRISISNKVQKSIKEVEKLILSSQDYFLHDPQVLKQLYSQNQHFGCGIRASRKMLRYLGPFDKVSYLFDESEKKTTCQFSLFQNIGIIESNASKQATKTQQYTSNNENYKQQAPDVSQNDILKLGKKDQKQQTSQNIIQRNSLQVPPLNISNKTASNSSSFEQDKSQHSCGLSSIGNNGEQYIIRRNTVVLKGSNRLIANKSSSPVYKTRGKSQQLDLSNNFVQQFHIHSMQFDSNSSLFPRQFSPILSILENSNKKNKKKSQSISLSNNESTKNTLTKNKLIENSPTEQTLEFHSQRKTSIFNQKINFFHKREEINLELKKKKHVEKMTLSKSFSEQNIQQEESKDNFLTYCQSPNLNKDKQFIVSFSKIPTNYGETEKDGLAIENRQQLK